ncbi:MAG: zinc ribbon domain-containing protein [Anaerolineales bacterium]|nr:zinc ribbon domain-containing protein [Anaerolineales bacterium]
MAIAVAVLIAVAALAAVLWPLFRPGPAPVLVEDDRLTALLQRKDATMVAIKDLEFDYRVGKLDSEDFEKYDQRLRRQAMSIMTQIDQLGPENAQLDVTIEQEIVQRRKVNGVAPAAATVKVASRPAPAPKQAAPVAAQGGQRYCTNCGVPADATHKFCANCGAAIAPA